MLYVGDESYEPEDEVYGEIFPNRAVGRVASFLIPSEVSPTQLVVSPSSVTLLPFLEDRIVYDLALVP